MATRPLTSRSSRPARAAARLAGVLLASFGFVWSLVALGVAGLTALGVAYHEAEMAMMLLAVAVLLPLFLFGFAAPRQGRVMALLTGGAALMAAAAWLLQRALLA